jgi:imidazolonepropionase-like amidohydrolase
VALRGHGGRGPCLELRDRPDQPTVLAAGPPITTPGGHCHFLGGTTEPTERDVRAAVRKHAERGVDAIKIMASGGAMTPGTREECPQFSAQVLGAAVDEAHRHGLPAVAHAHGTAAIVDALAARIDGIEHVTFWSADGVESPEELIGRIAERDVVVGATLGLAPAEGVTPPPEIASRLPQILRNYWRLRELGALVVAGTDAGISPVKPHGVLPYALPMLQHIGFAPAEALRAMTADAAHVCGLSHRKGRVATGYDADLLAVDGNPLVDSTALQRVRGVWARGRAIRL